ncbi:SDR family NAD(P)-dependent oxidoreductase [Arcticibacterium luteifluviistationis]|uniref:NAD(P)-dependent oxidoreductase n=1 Tax=Arcticibacterium luteifluviistationis TaxID=1784714 RepID=A0A2Z4G8T4_9BACT|nr:SDR family oxidoreductase [Arcticibacterium luteifluviistationis]AWV97566.1 NAD(P)-dependent oxidoreductase [Arcticibacterium luteifluviistationis]
MKRFENKNVLITGGNAGIGLETAHKFIAEGAKIVVFDIQAQKSAELEKINGDVHYIQCDVAKSENVKAAFKRAIDTVQKIDILINNAGILGPRVKTEDYPEEDFDRVIDINVKGVFYCMKEAISIFKNIGGGVIVNTASVAGKIGMSRHLAYSASKHAVIGMTKSAAVEYAKQNIRINAVCPGFTETSMLETINEEPEYKQMLRFATPMKRFGKPQEIATAILFLASDESSFMTGQGVVLDGGLSVQ